MNTSVKSFLLNSATTLAAITQVGDDPLSWMKIMPAGNFSARDGRGPYQPGNLESLEKIVERTRDYIGGTELMVDYDHQRTAPPEAGITAKAAGWIKKLDVREDGIWAGIEWTAAARAMIEAKEYRYLSPLFTHDKEGHVGLILNIALVNMPAIDLPAIAASLELNNGKSKMDKIAKSLGLTDGASEAVILVALTALQDLQVGTINALGLKDDADSKDVVTALAALVEDRAEITKVVGLSVDASSDQIVAAAAKLKTSDAGAPDPAKYVPIETVNALQAQVTELSNSFANDQAIASVDEAIKGGRLTPAQRDWGLSLYKSDAQAFSTFVENAPVLTAQQVTAATTKNTDKIVSLSAEQQSVATTLGLSHDAYLKTLQDEQNQEAVH